MPAKMDDLRAAIAEERWAIPTPRRDDSEHVALNVLTERLALPTATSDKIYGMREPYAAQSYAIWQNSALRRRTTRCSSPN